MTPLVCGAMDQIKCGASAQGTRGGAIPSHNRKATSIYNRGASASKHRGAPDPYITRSGDNLLVNLGATVLSRLGSRIQRRIHYIKSSRTRSPAPPSGSGGPSTSLFYLAIGSQASRIYGAFSNSTRGASAIELGNYIKAIPQKGAWVYSPTEPRINGLDYSLHSYWSLGPNSLRSLGYNCGHPVLSTCGAPIR